MHSILGVAHRDWKFENVLVRLVKGENGAETAHVYVVDWAGASAKSATQPLKNLLEGMFASTMEVVAEKEAEMKGVRFSPARGLREGGTSTVGSKRAMNMMSGAQTSTDTATRQAASQSGTLVPVPLPVHNLPAWLGRDIHEAGEQTNTIGNRGTPNWRAAGEQHDFARDCIAMAMMTVILAMNEYIPNRLELVGQDGGGADGKGHMKADDYIKYWLSDRGQHSSRRHTLIATVEEGLAFRWDRRILEDQGGRSKVSWELGQNKKPAVGKSGWEYSASLAKAVVHLLDQTAGVEPQHRCERALESLEQDFMTDA